MMNVIFIQMIGNGESEWEKIKIFYTWNILDALLWF